MLLEKLDIENHSFLFQRIEGTRRCSKNQEAHKVIAQLEQLGRKWLTFCKWLCNKEVAFCLWFYHINKNIASKRVLWNTNACESLQYRIKGSAEYEATNNNGLNILTAVSLLEKIDMLDAENVARKRKRCFAYTDTPV